MIFAETTTLAGMPPFDWQCALLVGLAVAAAAALVLTAGIATPVIAIQAGATWLGTANAVVGIAVITGAIGGVAAGFIKGGIEHERRVQQVARIERFGGQLDVSFEPHPDDPEKAVDFTCNLISYDETNVNQPLHRLVVDEADRDTFFRQFGIQLDNWLNRPVASDRLSEPRRVVIHMQPFPGNGVFERISSICDRRGGIIVSRVDGPWRSALRTKVVDRSAVQRH